MYEQLMLLDTSETDHFFESIGPILTYGGWCMSCMCWNKMWHFVSLPHLHSKPRSPWTLLK